MLCENCGIQNEPGARLCSNCGAPMPPRSSGGGFGDILSYKPAPAPVAPTPVVTTRPDPETQRIVAQLQKRVEETSKLALITVAAAGLALLFALIAFIICLSAPDHEENSGRNDSIAEIVGTSEEKPDSEAQEPSSEAPRPSKELPTTQNTESVTEAPETRAPETQKPSEPTKNTATNSTEATDDTTAAETDEPTEPGEDATTSNTTESTEKETEPVEPAESTEASTENPGV